MFGTSHSCQTTAAPSGDHAGSAQKSAPVESLSGRDASDGPTGDGSGSIGTHQTSAQTLTFPTAGFYPFQCDTHFALGMMGVIWVSP